MIAAWAIALKLLTNVIDEQLDQKLRNATATLSESTFPFSVDLLERFDKLIESRIALLDEQGVIGLSTGSALLNDSLQSNFLDSGSTADSMPEFRTIKADALQWRVAAQALPAGRDDRYRYVVAAASMDASRAAVRDAAILLAGAMLLATLALALLASYFITSITRPVADLARLANSISAGERGISAAIDERNEIGVLADALNEMATRLDAYEQDLTETSRLAGLGDLASRMAHEIRNPMTAIKMQLELLEERATESDRSRFQSLLDEIRRLELIVGSALSLGGAQSVNPVPGDPCKLVTDVASLLQPSLVHRRIKLTTSCAALPTMALDADRMKQVLLNLINNAADELAGGGDILLTAIVAEDESIHISVEDSGPGLPNTTQISVKPLGLGIGLKISREIVEGHGGELLQGRSEKLGGAKFTIRLPASVISAIHV